MNSNEVMDMAMRVYQNLGRNILGLTTVSTVFCLAAFTFVLYYALPSLGYTQNAANINVQVGEALLTMTLAIGIGGPLLVLGISYSSAIIVQLVSDFMLGNMPNVSTIRDNARRLWPKMFGVVLFETLISFAGMIAAGLFMLLSALVASNSSEGDAGAVLVSMLAVLALIAGLVCFPIVVCRHALTIPVVIIEGLSPWKAVKRSKELLKGTNYIPSGYGTLLTIFLVMGLLLFILSLGYASIISMLPELRGLLNQQAGTFLGAIIVKAVELAPMYLALWTVIPIWCTTTTVLYYERRIRWEGFDIEALAQDVWRTDRRSRFEL